MEGWAIHPNDVVHGSVAAGNESDQPSILAGRSEAGDVSLAIDGTEVVA